MSKYEFKHRRAHKALNKFLKEIYSVFDDEPSAVLAAASGPLLWALLCCVNDGVTKEDALSVLHDLTNKMAAQVMAKGCGDD